MASTYNLASLSDSPLPYGYYLNNELFAGVIEPRGTVTVSADVLDYSTTKLVAGKKLKLNADAYVPVEQPRVSAGNPMVFSNAWQSGARYPAGYVVKYNDFLWGCVNAHEAVTVPSGSNADWVVLAVVDSNVLYGVDLDTMTDGQIIFRNTPGSNFLAGLITDRNVDTISQSKITDLSTTLTGKLDIAGGTLTGALTLFGAPTLGLHAATKTYVDTFLPKSGGTMTGPIVLSGAPTSANHATTKAYVDGILGPGFLALTGGTMTGYITLNGNPISANHAVNKTYADLMLPKAGGNMSGYLSLVGSPTSALHAATKSYVDQHLLKSGGTMTGPITLSGAPSIANHATTKTYVDTQVAAGRTFAAKVSVPSGTLITDPGDLVTLEFLTGQSLDALPKAGGTMTGYIVLHAAPSLGTHPATKTYVDAADALALLKAGGVMTGAITGAHGLLPLTAGSTQALTGELSLFPTPVLSSAPKTGLAFSVEKQVPHFQGKLVNLVGREVTTTGTYTVLAYDGIINADSSSNPVVVTLNASTTYPSMPITIRKSGASYYAPVYVRIPNFDGRDSTYVLSKLNESITLWPSSQWVILGRSRPSTETFTVIHTSTTNDAGVMDVLWGVRGYEDGSYAFSAVTDETGGLIGFNVGAAYTKFQAGDVFTVTDSTTYDEEYVVDSIETNKVVAAGTWGASSTGQINGITRPALDGATVKIVHVRVTDSLTDPWTLSEDIELAVTEGDEVHPGPDAAKVVRSRVTGAFQVDITNNGDPRTVYMHILSSGELHGHVNGGFDSAVTSTVRYASNITAAAASGGDTELTLPHTHGFEAGDVVTVSGTGGLYDGSQTVVSKTSTTLVIDVAYSANAPSGTVTSVNAVSFVATDPSGFAADQYIYTDGITAVGASRTAFQLVGVVTASNLLVVRSTTYDSGLVLTGFVGVLPVIAVEFT